MTNSAPRTSWLDDEGGVAIGDLVQRLESYVEAMADGIVSSEELETQERRVIDLMREVEPQLDDALHAMMTQLLCEVTALDIMQVLHMMQAPRSKTTFRG